MLPLPTDEVLGTFHLQFNRISAPLLFLTIFQRPKEILTLGRRFA